MNWARMNWARMNWARMNWALGSRGEVTLWIDEAVLSGWRASGGKGKVHSDAAILCTCSNHAAVLARVARPMIPPRKGAAREESPPPTRSEAVRRIAEVGRKVWKTETGYPKRSLSKTTMVRFQTIIGATLKPRSLANQKTEASVAVRCLNSVTALGMPVGIKIA